METKLTDAQASAVYVLGHRVRRVVNKASGGAVTRWTVESVEVAAKAFRDGDRDYGVAKPMPGFAAALEAIIATPMSDPQSKLGVGGAP